MTVTPTSTPALFQPLRVGRITISHRVAMAPLARSRANAQHVHGDLAVEYYKQRASTPGTLLVAEATCVAERAVGLSHMPGIWDEDQVKAWKRVIYIRHVFELLEIMLKTTFFCRSQMPYTRRDRSSICRYGLLGVLPAGTLLRRNTISSPAATSR